MTLWHHSIYLAERGTLHIAKVNPNSYQEVAQVKVLDRTCWTPPVLWQGRLFIRNDKGKLICLDLRK